MAQAVGADYVAPYLGRIADGIGKSYLANTSSDSFSSPEEHQQEIKQAATEAALDAVAAMQAGVTATGSQMRVLVASIRDASDMSTLAARVSHLGAAEGQVQERAAQGRQLLRIVYWVPLAMYMAPPSGQQKGLLIKIGA